MYWCLWRLKTSGKERIGIKFTLMLTSISTVMLTCIGLCDQNELFQPICLKMDKDCLFIKALMPYHQFIACSVYGDLIQFWLTFEAILVLNNRDDFQPILHLSFDTGIPIRSNLSDEDTENYAALVSQLAIKAHHVVR